VDLVTVGWIGDDFLMFLYKFALVII